MSIANDQEVVNQGRKGKLKDNASENLKVTASLRDQIVMVLQEKLNDQGIGQKIVETWSAANADRVQALERQSQYLKEFDEFIEPLTETSAPWMSNLHLPTILSVGKTFHARMYSALMSIDPPFNVRARQEANVDRAKLVEQLMRYTITDWANDYEGIKAEIDEWLWDWCMAGSGVLKCRWDKKYTKFIDVENVPVPDISFDVDPETGERIQIVNTRIEEQVKTKIIETCNAPAVDVVNIEDIVIIGGKGNPQKADYVIQQSMLTASELWSFADQGIFDADEVEEVIRSGDSSETSDVTGAIKQVRKENAGLAQVDKEYDIPRYKILEAYLEADVDGTGINSQIVVWVHAETKRILRATYLLRIMPTGLRPFFKIDFHRRKGSEWGVGLVELLYSLSKEIDAMHNMRMDVGIITSMPWGFYRPINSMSEEKYQIEPGALIPVDNPASDVYFPNLGNRTSFGFQEEQALVTHVERVTSVSDLSFGIIGGQGAARTATGTRAIVGEASANLDIYIQRLHRGWKPFLKYLFHLLQLNLPNGFQFRVLGDDGNNYWTRVERREELQGMYDFEIEANSINSNKQIQQDQANLTLQLVQNPLLLQLGIVSTMNLYNAAKNAMMASGIKDVSKYITKPQNVQRVFTPLEIANRILMGIDVPLDPTQDLAGLIEMVNNILKDDELLGQFGGPETAALVAKMQEAIQMQAAVEQIAAQQQNRLQQQTNARQSVAGQSFGEQQAMGSQQNA